MIYILQNVLPILVATIVSFAFGAAYYSFLGKPWMAATGLREEDIRENPSPLPFIIAFVMNFWIASILTGALLLAPDKEGPWAMALGTCFIIWLGFILPTMVVNHRYQMKPWSLTLIDSAHWLGVLIAQACVLTGMGISLP